MWKISDFCAVEIWVEVDKAQRAVTEELPALGRVHIVLVELTVCHDFTVAGFLYFILRSYSSIVSSMFR